MDSLWICEGCGRHWSDPIPAHCPECGTEFPVQAPTPDSPDYIVGISGGEPVTDVGPANYYCGQCNIFHKAGSGIGLRHRPE